MRNSSNAASLAKAKNNLMAALLPISAGVKRKRQAPPKRQGITPTVYAPSIGLPLRFVLTGILTLFAGMIWIAFRPDILTDYHYGPHVIALTHLFLLGWITSIIMGATYQLVPVALETRLYSEKLGRRQYWLHLTGFAGMVWMFWPWSMKGVLLFGSLLAAGAVLFVYNIARTLARVPKWNVIAFGVAASLFWFSLTVLAGLYLAAAKTWVFSPFAPMAQMHAHAHLGGAGFFVMMIVTVSYKLMPMFALSELQNPRRAWWSLWLLNGGLLGLFVTMLLMSPWKLPFALVMTAGLAFYGIEMAAMLRARKRRVLDWGLKTFLTAISLLAPLSVLGIILSWPGLPATAFTAQLENVYGLLAFLGVITLAILGMLYKIVPFLVWYARYSSEIGKSKVPSLADLHSPNLQVISYWLFVIGLAATCMAIAVQQEGAARASWTLIVASLVFFAINMGQILSHFFRPRIEPLNLKPPTKTA
jgi:hypothetical protein